MADYHLWGVIRRPAGLDAYVVVITALPHPPSAGGELRVEMFSADTIAEAESIRGNKLMEWGYEIRSRGYDSIVDVVDDDE